VAARLYEGLAGLPAFNPDDDHEPLLTPPLVDGREELEVGYHVRRALPGHGYATEAAAAARDFARDRLGARRLTAIIHPANRPSQRVAEKIGLRQEKRIQSGAATGSVLYAASL
jgi:RimJ/RimL family protein N-acetyltransferase